MKKTSIEYRNSHFVVVFTDINAKGKEYDRAVEIKGTVSDNSVVFTYDANNYVVCTNSFEKVYDDITKALIGFKPFFRTYTRCKESSANYYFKSHYAKENQKLNESIGLEFTSGLTFNEIFNRAKDIFKPTTVKRALEVVDLCESKARTAHNAKLKAEKRASEKAMEAKSIYEAVKQVVNG